MNRLRTFWLATISMVVGFLGIFLLVEVMLRFLPVARNPLVVPVTAREPVFRYAPNRSFVFSRDWDLHLVNHGWVNNAGMVNDQDYTLDGETPLLAVIGDSYIEAMMVPYDATLQGRLAATLDGKVRVYSFGASGAPLSQYLVWSRHATRTYGAKWLIINVVGNDFDESHNAFKTDFPGFWIYAPGADGDLRLRLFEFHVGRVRSFVKHSSFARYLFVNLHLKQVLSKRRLADVLEIGDTGGGVPRYAGNTAADTGKARINASIAAIEAFFRDLPDFSGLPPESILFTMDGPRYPDEAIASAGTYFDRMRREFEARAEARGYEVIDASSWFLTDFRERGRPFEDPRDRHWNGTAHGVVAKAVLQSDLFRQFRPGQQ